MDVLVREIRERELPEVGEITAAAYRGLVGEDYLAVLRDARPRFDAPATTILAAFDDGTDGVLGSVVYAAPGSDWRDVAEGEQESEVRMLAVAPAAQGRGVGEALMRACIARARAEGRARLVLSSADDMKTAHRLYARLGFRRVEDRDWTPVPGITLMFFELDLTAEDGYCGQCGKALGDAAANHGACTARAELEPPRFCAQCGRRMVVQVVPTGWTARCSRHGVLVS